MKSDGLPALRAEGDAGSARAAVADIKGLRLSGFPAWALWLLVHLVYLIGFQNRLLVVLRWTISFLTRGRGARLILTSADRTGAQHATTNGAAATPPPLSARAAEAAFTATE